jgi:hypothetical protein
MLRRDNATATVSSIFFDLGLEATMVQRVLTSDAKARVSGPDRHDQRLDPDDVHDAREIGRSATTAAQGAGRPAFHLRTPIAAGNWRRGKVEDGRGSLGPMASAPFPIPAHQ